MSSDDSLPPSASARQWRPVLGRAIWYAVAGITAVAFVVTWFRGYPYDTNGIVPDGGDSLWTQGMFESVSQQGMFSVNPHLHWPDGLSVWSHPQLGVLVMSAALAVMRMLAVGSGMAIFWVTAVVAGVNALAVCYFLMASSRGIKSRIAAAVLAFAAAISPFLLDRTGQLGVAAFFCVPVAFGALVRVQSLRKGLPVLVLVAVASLLSPLWWCVVAAFLTMTAAIAWLARRDWPLFRWTMSVAGALTVGIFVQSLFYRSASVSGQLPTRGPWDSNAYGGHLVDLALASPWLTSVTEVIGRLAPGASIELSRVGMTGALAAAVAVTVVVAVPPLFLRSGRDVRVLSALSVSAVLWFLIGGFGNLQAGLAVLVGSSSPARVWSRLLLLLALIGLAWAITFATESRALARLPIGLRWAGVASTVAVVVFASFLDASRVAPRMPIARESFPEYEVASYLQDKLAPCPVAQLPLDGMPAIRVWDRSAQQVVDLYYRGLVPYLMAPDFFWTVGPYQPERADNLNTLPVTLDSDSLGYLRSQGYCALLFDSLLADAARSSGATLQGMELGDVGAPELVAGRYLVFLLN